MAPAVQETVPGPGGGPAVAVAPRNGGQLRVFSDLPPVCDLLSSPDFVLGKREGGEGAAS